MKKPNLIYIFADQLRFNSLGYNQDTNAETPNIDAFCRESTNLCQAVSGHPVCAPYRASLLTGKYTTSTGMVINEIRMNTNHHTFADVLNENGYETAYIGKWHMYANEWGNHYDSGNSYIPEGRNRLGFNDYFAAYNFHHEYSVGTAYYHQNSPEKIYYDKYEPDAQTDMAIEQLQRLSEKEVPFAFFLSIGTPHDPWVKENVPARYYERFKRIVHVSLPGITPTIVTLLILKIGQIMSIGFEKAYLLQNDLNLKSSEIISTLVYKQGILQGNVGYATAVGLMNSCLNLLLIIAANKFCEKFFDTSLW